MKPAIPDTRLNRLRYWWYRRRIAWRGHAPMTYGMWRQCLWLSRKGS